MVSVEESEKLGNLLNELEQINAYIKDVDIRETIKNIIERFDEVIC